MDHRDTHLFEVAKKAYDYALARFTHYRVGAALLVSKDIIIPGCNVESLVPSNSICAERSALFAALAHGYKKFEKIVIVMDAKIPTLPCGSCAQLLNEFAPDIMITSYNLQGKSRTCTLKELLPFAHTI